MKSLLMLCCLAVACANTIVVPGRTTTYTYRYAAPQHSKQETRDHLGSVHGSYRVHYSHGGVLTQHYHFPRPHLRLVHDGPLGAAGTLIALRNSKHSAFLREMLENALDERAPPVVTRTEGVLVEATPVFVNSKVSPFLLQLREESEATSGLREQQLQISPAGDALILEAALADTPGDAVFLNSKISPVLVELRLQSEEGLIGRGPPLEGHNSFIVEARGAAGEEV